MSKRKLQQSPNAPYDRFRTLFEQSLDAVYIGTPDGAIVDVNQAWLDLFGYERDDLANLNATALYADPAERADFVRRMNETGFVRDEIRYRRKDGSVFDCQRVQAAMRDADGNVVAYQGVIRNITEQKKAEEALGVELAWRRILLEQSRDGIVVLDQEGKVVEANLKFARMLGYSPEEVLQLHVQDWDVPTPRERLEEMIRDVDESGDHFETQHRRKDGTVYDVEISTNAAVFGEQKLVFCVCRDITERKRVQKALEKSEASLRFLTEHTADIIWTMDMEFRTTYMSPSVERVLGFTAEEWMHLRFDEVATPESVSREYAAMQKQLALEASGTADPNRTLTIEVEMYHKSGSTVWMELVIRAIRDDAGRLVGMVGVSRDITERRKTISALRESEQRLSQLARHSRAVAWEVDLDGLFTYVSPVVEEVLGPHPDDLVGKRHFYDLIPTEGREEVKVRALSAIRAGADITDVESPMARADGGLLWVAISGVPLRNSDGALVGYRGWVIDITARKTAELTLRTSEQRFRSLFEQSMDAINIVAPDARILEANQAWLDLFGYAREDLTTLKASDIYAEPGVRGDFLRRVNEAGYVRDRVRLKKKDGTLFDCERSVVALRDQSGALIAFQGVHHDITAQKLAARAVNESEAKYRALFEHSMDAISLVSPGGLLLEANKAYLDLFGYKKQDIGVANVEGQYVEPSDRTRMLEWMVYHDDLVDDPVRLRKRDGTVMDCLRTVVARRDADGTVIGEQSVIRDITDRKRTEQALSESEEHFRSLFEQSMDAIYIGKLDGTIIDVNQAWLDLFGYTREELPHVTMVGLYVDPDERKSFLRRIQSSGEIQDEVRLKKKDGTAFDCERTAVVRRDREGNVVAFQGIMRDVTQRKRDREELERLARFDTLTGLLNRRTIMEKLDEWLRHSQRYKRQLSAVMLDIDRFKQVNDQYGHQVGDRVLADTAHLLQRSLRQTDFAGRYGGEEFLLVLPQTDAASAAIISERARVILQGAEMQDSDGGTFNITASFGVAEWRDGDNVDALVGKADAALYQAKAAGRNRVEVEPSPQQATPEK